MTTMNISLPDDMKAFVDQQVRLRAYASSSEYLRDLIRRQKEIEDFRQRLHSASQSPMPASTDSEFIEGLRARARTSAAE